MTLSVGATVIDKAVVVGWVCTFININTTNIRREICISRQANTDEGSNSVRTYGVLSTVVKGRLGVARILTLIIVTAVGMLDICCYAFQTCKKQSMNDKCGLICY